jgi:hypothetical protein
MGRPCVMSTAIVVHFSHFVKYIVYNPVGRVFGPSLGTEMRSSYRKGLFAENASLW